MARRRLRVKIKGHRRRSFIKDVKPGKGRKLRRIRATRVRRHVKLIRDRGALGRTPRRRRWFKPRGTLKGWNADMSESERKKRAAIGRSDLSSARALLALSNVTTDRETKRAARADAEYFFRKHRR